MGFQIPTLKYYPDFCEKSKVNTTAMPQENDLLGSSNPGGSTWCICWNTLQWVEYKAKRVPDNETCCVLWRLL